MQEETILTPAQTSAGQAPRRVRLTEAARAAMVAHALQARPEECCGLLSGAGSTITDVHPLRNEAERPETRYFASPEDLFAAMRRIREAGHRLLGIYHSHPRAPAYPSQTDVELAFYPEAVYFIISLEPRLDMGAFRIDAGRIETVEVEVGG